MAQRAVSDGEIVRLAWEAEDRRRLGASYLAQRKLGRRDALYLMRYTLGGRLVWGLIARRSHVDRQGWITASEDVFEFADGDAAWRAAIGWDGRGEPLGFARYRRRA